MKGSGCGRQGAEQGGRSPGCSAAPGAPLRRGGGVYELGAGGSRSPSTQGRAGEVGKCFLSQILGRDRLAASPPVSGSGHLHGEILGSAQPAFTGSPCRAEGSQVRCVLGTGRRGDLAEHEGQKAPVPLPKPRASAAPSGFRTNRGAGGPEARGKPGPCPLSRGADRRRVEEAPRAALPSPPASPPYTHPDACACLWLSRQWMSLFCSLSAMSLL